MERIIMLNEVKRETAKYKKNLTPEQLLPMLKRIKAMKPSVYETIIRTIQTVDNGQCIE